MTGRDISDEQRRALAETLAEASVADEGTAQAVAHALAEAAQALRDLEQDREAIQRERELAVDQHPDVQAWRARHAAARAAMDTIEAAHPLPDARVWEEIKADLKGWLQAYLDHGGARPEGCTTQLAWEPEIVDISEVPRGYLTIDARALAEHAKKYRCSSVIPEIPGVRWRRRERVIAR